MHVLSAGILICLSAPGFGAHGDDQPTQQVLRIEPDGTWRLFGVFSKTVLVPESYTVNEKVPVTVQKTVEENGQTVLKNVTEYQTVTRQQTRMSTRMVSEMMSSKIRPDTVRAFETDGRKIANADLQRRIQGDTLIVVSNNGKPVPSHYLSIFKPGTIVLVEFVAEHAPPVPGTFPPGVIQPLPQPAPGPRVPLTAPPQSRRESDAIFRNVAFQQESTPRVAQDSNFPRLPASPAPEIVFLSRDGADAIKVRQFRETQSPSTVRISEKGLAKEIQVSRTTRHSDTTSLPWTAVQISADGKDLPTDRAKERLGAGETTGLLSKDGKEVDPFWLQNIKPTVLVVRGVELTGSPMPQYAPAPMAMPLAVPMPVPAPAAPTKDTPPPGPPVPVPARVQ